MIKLITLWLIIPDLRKKVKRENILWYNGGKWRWFEVVIDWVYVLSQVLTVIEYGLLGLSYLAKNRKAVVLLDIASMAMEIVAFLLLGADLGMAMSVVILVANFYYLWDEHKNGARDERMERYSVLDYVVLTVVLLLIGVLASLTYDGPLSLLSVAATVLYEISIWQKSTKVYKFLGIPVAGCWMAYNGAVRSIFGVICEFWMLAAAIYGYVKEVRGARKGVSGKRRVARSSSGRRISGERSSGRSSSGRRSSSRRSSGERKKV